jgi:hypothetical protein
MAPQTSILRSDGPIWQFLSSPEGKALALTALIMMTAGCSGLTGGDDGSGGSQGAPINDIPEGVDVVMHMESGVLQDQTTAQLMNGLIEMDSAQAGEMDGETPENWSEVLREFENETDLSVNGFHTMTVFGKSSGLASSQGMTDDSQGMDSANKDYAGAIMQTDWTWQEMIEAADQDPSVFREETYQGVTVYVNESVENLDQVDEAGWIADMGSGKYAMGPKEVVQDIIDTNQGNMPAFSGEIRQAYENAPDGYMKMAANVSDRAAQAASSAAGGSMMMGASSAQGVEIMTMTYYTNGGEMTMEMQMQMESQKKATEIADLKSLLTMSVSSESQGPATPGENPAAWAVNTLEFQQNGASVTMSFGATPQELLDLLKGMNQQQATDSGVDFSIGQSERLAG